MRGIDLQASVSNLTQMDRVQNDAQRMPAVNQAATSIRLRDQGAERVTRPGQPDAAEKGAIDPDDSRHESPEKQRKRKQQAQTQHGRPRNTRETGHFVDLDA